MPTRTLKKKIAANRPLLRLTVQYSMDTKHWPDRATIKTWLQAALTEDLIVTVRFVEEEEGRRLNRDYRGKDYATNVLSFPYTTSPPYVGDLILCVPVIERESIEQGKPLAAHYAHLIIHGALHLLGFDHQTEKDAQVMEDKETNIMRQLKFADPYLLPAGHPQ